MKLPYTRLPVAFLGALAIATGGPAYAQVSLQTLKKISIPDTVETSIGKLEFFDGVPANTNTVEKVYDHLDRMRGTQVFLDNVGAVSMYSVRKGLDGAGAQGAD